MRAANGEQSIPPPNGQHNLPRCPGASDFEKKATRQRVLPSLVRA